MVKILFAAIPEVLHTYFNLMVSGKMTAIVIGLLGLLGIYVFTPEIRELYKLAGTIEGFPETEKLL